MKWNPNSSAAANAVALLLLALGSSVAEAQAAATWADSFVVLTPGPLYAKGGLYRAIAGKHYRDLWTTPIRVPVLDLSRFAGGTDTAAGALGEPDEIDSIRGRGRTRVSVSLGR